MGSFENVTLFKIRYVRLKNVCHHPLRKHAAAALSWVDLRRQINTSGSSSFVSHQTRPKRTFCFQRHISKSLELSSDQIHNNVTAVFRVLYHRYPVCNEELFTQVRVRGNCRFFFWSPITHNP